MPIVGAILRLAPPAAAVDMQTTRGAFLSRRSEACMQQDPVMQRNTATGDAAGEVAAASGGGGTVAAMQACAASCGAARGSLHAALPEAARHLLRLLPKVTELHIRPETAEELLQADISFLQSMWPHSPRDPSPSQGHLIKPAGQFLQGIFPLLRRHAPPNCLSLLAWPSGCERTVGHPPAESANPSATALPSSIK